MPTNENAPSPTADEFAIVVDNCGKLDLLEIERELSRFNPKLHVIDQNEQRYGEPGTILLVALIGSLALPPLLLWLAKHKKGFKISEKEKRTLPDGTEVESSRTISVIDSAPPSAQQLRELWRFPGVDPAEIAKAYNIDLTGSGKSDK
jgi:hypothetical protein